MSGIDKIPTADPVLVSAPGPKPVGGSGLDGDSLCDTKNHGGDDQAVYAYAREDLDWWETELGTPLRSGMFGENLTTLGLDVTGALIGERWRIGRDVILQVTCPRIPCGTFRAWMDRPGWVKRFTQRAVSGAYLKVVTPGAVRVNDGIVVAERPDHDVTIGMLFRALTTDRDLLPRVMAAGPYLTEEARLRAERREQFQLF